MSDILLGKFKKQSNYVYKGLNTHSKPTRVWVEHGSRHCTLERRIFMFAGWFVSSNSGLSPLVDHPSLTPMAIWSVFFPYFETDPLRNLRGRLQFIVKKVAAGWQWPGGFSGVWHWSCPCCPDDFPNPRYPQFVLGHLWCFICFPLQFAWYSPKRKIYLHNLACKWEQLMFW